MTHNLRQFLRQEEEDSVVDKDLHFWVPLISVNFDENETFINRR